MKMDILDVSGVLEMNEGQIEVLNSVLKVIEESIDPECEAPSAENVGQAQGALMVYKNLFNQFPSGQTAEILDSLNLAADTEIILDELLALEEAAEAEEEDDYEYRFLEPGEEPAEDEELVYVEIDEE